MDKTNFIDLLKGYGLDAEHVYEDISELGEVLWHNDKLALKVAWPQDKQPCVLVAILRPTGTYSYFECGLKEFDKATIAQVMEYVKDNAGHLYDAAVIAQDVLAISIGDQDWSFGSA